MQKLKILHTVQFYHPSVGGMQEVVKQISEKLAAFGHNVTVATSKDKNRISKIINGVNVIDFDIQGNAISGFSGKIKEYQDFLLNSDFDIVTNFAAQQWATDLMLPILSKIKAKKIFVPTGFSGLYHPKYKDYFAEMKNWIKKYDMNIFLSDDYRDINFAKENKIKKRILIPNGASAEEFRSKSKINLRQKLAISKTSFLILHVGSHTGIKGHAEAMQIFTNAKIQNAVLLIIGNDFQDKGSCLEQCQKFTEKFNSSAKNLKLEKKIILQSLNRKETIAAYQTADLFLFPSNLECSPIVLFECMASKTPFLVTDVGNAKEIIEWSKTGILLPTLKNARLRKLTLKEIIFKIILFFLGRYTKNNSGLVKAKINQSAKILEKIIQDKESRKIMKKSGYNAWGKRFTWDVIAKQYENLYLKLTNPRQSSSAGSVL